MPKRRCANYRLVAKQRNLSSLSSKFDRTMEWRLLCGLGQGAAGLCGCPLRQVEAGGPQGAGKMVLMGQNIRALRKKCKKVSLKLEAYVNLFTQRHTEISFCAQVNCRSHAGSTTRPPPAGLSHRLPPPHTITWGSREDIIPNQGTVREKIPNI